VDLGLAGILFVAGAAAGVINTMAGGGSFITIAALLLAGLPADVANATNRLGVLLQSGTSTAQFHRADRLDLSAVVRLAPSAVAGALLGSWLSIDIDVGALRQIIGVVMLMMLAVVVLRPQRWLGEPSARHPALQQLGFFAIGVYGGFLQAGVGVFLLMGLSLLAGLDLIRANGVKVALVAAYTLPALALYAYSGLIDWVAGGALALGGGLGGLLGARAALWGGAGLVRIVLIVVLAVSGVRLLIG
jgi:uncharacterized membrane protein YfcA